MKKWTHLYIFAVLSGIATLYRLWGVLSSSFNEEAFRASLESAQGVSSSVVEETIAVTKASTAFQTNMVHKIFAVVLVVLLIGFVYLLFKKRNEQASYVYSAYLFGTLLLSTYDFIGSKGTFSLYTDETLRQASSGVAFVYYIVLVVLFAVYFGLTLFFLLRKPKPLMETGPSQTDI